MKEDHIDLAKYIEQHLVRHTSSIRSLMRQPSISSQQHGVEDAALLTAELHREAGFQEVELLETDGYPVVAALLDSGSDKTLGIYGFFDTNVAEPGWSHDPLGAEVGATGRFPKVVFGLGASSKPPLVGCLSAIETILNVRGKLPVNIVVLAEGEEWLASPHVSEAIKQKWDWFRNCDAVIWPGTCQAADGQARVYLGNKGFIYLQLTSAGSQWGRGPLGSVHGSTLGIVESPVWHLVDALSTMTSEAGQVMSVEGLGEHQHELNANIQDFVQSLVAKHGDMDLASVIPGIGGAENVASLVENLDAEAMLRRYMLGTTLNLSGISAGYTGPGNWQFGLPSTASCTLDIRFPPGVHAQDLLTAVSSHLEKRGFGDISMKCFGAYDGAIASPDHNIVVSALEVLRAWSVPATLWPLRATAGPLGIFSEQLGVPVLGDFSVGHSGSAGKDAYFVLEGNDPVGGLLDYELSMSDFMYEFSRVASGSLKN